MLQNSHRRAIQVFEVSLKAAIVHDRRLLLVKEADTGFWELPGGRIDVGEERLRHDDIVAREIREELGGQVRVRLSHLSTSFVRQRPTDGVFQFLMVRLAMFDGGTIQLSDEHSGYQWFGADQWQSLIFPELSDYPNALQAVWRLIDTLP